MTNSKINYTNPINPKMTLTLNAYTRRRRKMGRIIDQYTKLDSNHIDYIQYKSPEYFQHIESDISEFYLDLGYTEEQVMQMKEDMTSALIDSL
tara:strand:+ start:53 stop:331 length:279 start_codon:yes stop_codon:yes gene_type:complete